MKDKLPLSSTILSYLSTFNVRVLTEMEINLTAWFAWSYGQDSTALTYTVLGLNYNGVKVKKHSLIKAKSTVFPKERS